MGIRLLEDLSCMDELLGAHQYSYRLLGESDCSIRGKEAADSEMEFHHGTYEDLDAEDYAILDRVTAATSEYLHLTDTALVFPIGFKEHYDHFIVREGVRKAMKKGGSLKFYYAEEKPLSGLANAAELARIDSIVAEDNV